MGQVKSFPNWFFAFLICKTEILTFNSINSHVIAFVSVTLDLSATQAVFFPWALAPSAVSMPNYFLYRIYNCIWAYRSALRGKSFLFHRRAIQLYLSKDDAIWYDIASWRHSKPSHERELYSLCNPTSNLINLPRNYCTYGEIMTWPLIIQ